ncbi:MAG: hypothetical protein LWX56_11595 [Ignavibacteria bacterium]|nr:hypothetical protein [Ignavibacteria bacterium]
MRNLSFMLAAVLCSVFCLSVFSTSIAQEKKMEWLNSSVNTITKTLIDKYGTEQKERIISGIKQVSEFWRTEDGGKDVFEGFIQQNFAGDKATQDELFNRLEYVFEKLDGHMNEIGREMRLQQELDLGPMLPIDELFAGYNTAAHLNDDFFANKVAFVVLLNFPLKSLEDKIAYGASWSRRQWAEVRLAERFSKRIPADVQLAVSKAAAASDQYIADYNIYMYNIINEKGEHLFPQGMRLLSHWNLRDEIKSNYADPVKNLEKQLLIQKIMERIVDQTIPEVVINNPNYDWNPYSNKVTPVAKPDPAFAIVKTEKPEMLAKAEPDTRYKMLLDDFIASKMVDPYSPTARTHIDRKFNEEREIPENRFKQILLDVLQSPLAKTIGDMIEARLGRKLQPFDIWYNGFVPKSKYTPEELDAIVRKKYPNPKSFQDDMPNILKKLGFSDEKAQFLAANIAIDPARGSGHAMGAYMREAKARLRTRVGKDGMDYKGFNIAVHEFGHNVEQTFSMHEVGNMSLQGVPNTAFTEAIAFVFQAQDLNLLGLAAPDEKTEAMKTLNDYWMTYEIAGVALIDMEIWHWMYEHQNASPAEVKAAMLMITKNIWNTYYAPVFGVKDVTILGVYSHIIHSFLYLPDYPLGHLIAFQIEEQIKKSGTIGPEVERIARQGRLLPDLWMKNAFGVHVGAESLLEATNRAVKILKK